MGKDVSSLREELKAKMIKQGENMQVKNVEEVLANQKFKALKLGIVGIGQGGGKVASEFHQFNYKVIAINTALQDLALLNLPDNQKFHIDWGLGSGAGKDLNYGETIFSENIDKVKLFLEQHLGPNLNSVDQLVLCVSLGGGTGTSSIVPFLNLCQEMGVIVNVICTLPQSHETCVTKSNSLHGLDSLTTLSQTGVINSLILIDNSRIEELYEGITFANLFKVANFDVVNIFNHLNTLSSLPSSYSSIDPTDYLKIVSSGNFSVYGKVTIPLTVENGQVIIEDEDLASALMQNTQQSLFAEGFDFSEAIRVGVYVCGAEKYLNQIPATVFSHAFTSLAEMFNSADIFKGVYFADTDEQLDIYLLASGLGLPKARVGELKEQAQSGMATFEKKEAQKANNMSVFNQTSKKEETNYKNQKNKNSVFNKMVAKKK